MMTGILVASGVICSMARGARVETPRVRPTAMLMVS